ncbi:general transcription factor 3C polypeptide 1 [Anopheles maculipalpis]|uniref:general transcription factor 3C polypeptide 1 n=1 Tax=Anopheles maculipalpis TaxID=1496333 RepID=UPI002159898B|nr:general transcription factor 3C polypeptide 1 [Anopheles maculipalpis]
MLPNASLPSIVNEEISLEGLEGSTLDSLWNHVAIRLKLPMPLPPKLMGSIWTLIMRNSEFEFYLLLNERKPFAHFNRLGNLDPENGIAVHPSEFPGHRYAYRLVEANGVRGSCEEYDTRTSIPRDELRTINCFEAELRYGRKFVIVASQRMRESFIIVQNCTAELTGMQYCILEWIGRSRFSGETSHGKYSLVQISGDSSSLFYHRKVLSAAKLITRQNLSIRIDDTSIQGMVFHLPRYYTEMKTKQLLVVERVVNELKRREHFMADYEEIKMMVLNKPDAGKLFRSPEFQRYIKMDEMVPFRTLYPDAPQSSWMTKRGGEKMIRVMRLIDPKADVYDVWNREMAEEGGADAKDGFLASADSDAIYVDVPLLQLAYNVIANHGGKGISQSEMAQELGLDKLNSRAVVKNLSKLKCIESMTVDEGRQRTSKFFIPGHSQRSAVFEQEVSQFVSNQMNVIESQRAHIAAIESVMEPPPGRRTNAAVESVSAGSLGSENAYPLSNDSLLRAAERNAYDSALHDNIITEVVLSDSLQSKEQKRISTAVLTKSISEKVLQRCNFIIELVKQAEAIEPQAILKSLKQREMRIGNQYTACSKSLMRLINRLSADRMVQFAHVRMQRDEREYRFVYVCDPKITVDHPALLTKLAMAKSRIVLQQTHLKGQGSGQGQEAEVATRETSKLCGYHGCLPKCPRMKLYHEYLFYTAHVQPRDARELDVSELKSINLEGVDENELSPIYSDTNDWKMFVPPLNLYDGYGSGWVLLIDVVIRMPMYVFCSICAYSFYTPALDYYLNHPIRKYTLLKHLPDPIRMQLLQNRRYIYAILDVTKLLCYAGLLQMGPQLRKTRDQTYVYLNQYACLLDTTGSKDGYHEIEARKYPMIQFRLETMEDVKEYWDKLYDIAMSTRINSRNTAIGRVVCVQHVHSKPAMIDALRVQTEETAALNDRPGRLPPGDEKGAAGFDKAMFMHLKTNWQKMLNTSQYRHRIDKHRLKAVRRSLKMKKKQNESATPVVDDSGRGGEHQSLPLSDIVPAIPRKYIRKKLIRKRVVKPRKLTLRRWREGCDEVDKRALKKMSNLRVKWSRAEDQILIMCRVAQLYLYSTHTVTCPVNSSTFRDVLHWSNARSACKTSSSCQRRVLYMIKKVPGVADTIRTCLEETKQNPLIAERYGPGFTKKLRERYEDVEDYMVAARIHFVQLVHMVRQFCSNLIRGSIEAGTAVLPRAAVRGHTTEDGSGQMYTFCIPDTIEELYRQYNITDTTNSGKQLNYATDPATLQDLQMYKLTILMHSAVTFGRTTEPLQNVYREYSESILTGAMRLMRNYHLVSMNKKLKGVGTKLLVTHTPATEDRELYHVSIHYQQQLMTSLPFDLFVPIFCQYMQLLDRKHYEELCAYDDDAQGLVLLLSELLTMGRVDVHIDQEADYIKVRADTKEKVPSYSDVLLAEQQDTVPGSGTDKPTKPGTPFKTPTDKSLVPGTKKLRFSPPKDVTAQYVAHPVEKLLKLPIEYFHFFCLFEQLQVPDRRLIVQTFKIDESQPATCSLPSCICSMAKAGGTGGGVRNEGSDLVSRCLSTVRRRNDLFARIKQHVADRSNRKNRVDSAMMFEVREDNLLPFFNKYMADFRKRWTEKQKRDVNRQNQTLQVLVRSIANMVELIDECLRFDEEMPEYNWLDRYEMSNAVEDEDVGESEQSETRTGDSLKALSEKVFKLHNFYEVLIRKVHIRMKTAPLVEQFGPNALTDRECYDQWNVPRCFLPDGAKRRRETLVKLMGDALWPSMEQLERPLQEAMAVIERNANANALLAYIESRQRLGVSVLELAQQFPNHGQLKQHLHALCGFKLLLRTGFRTITYVHWQFVEEWLTKAPVPETKQRTEPEPQVADTSKGGSIKRKGGSILDVEERMVKRAKTGTTEETRMDDSGCQHPAKKHQRKYMLLAMAPWMRIDGLINKRLLFRWLISILLYCVAHPGVPLNVLFVRYNMMSPFHLRQLLEMLQNYGCITLHSMQYTVKKTIFSVFSPVTVVPPTEFLPDEQTFVEVVPDALSTLSLCIGENRKYVHDIFDPVRKNT